MNVKCGSVGELDRRRGETRQGGATHGLFLRGKEATSAYMLLTPWTDHPGHFVVNITLHSVAFGSCFNNTRGREVIPTHPSAPHKTEAQDIILD